MSAGAQTTLQEQINNAEAGTTVTLTDNVTLTARIDINKNITVDLNNHTITTTATCGNGSAFNIVSGTVTIQNGTIDASFGESNNGETDAITARSGSDVTLKDLNITVKSKNGACAYAFDGGKITIKSGVYENLTTETYQYNANIKAMVVNQANVATQLVFIEGGTFKGYDPTLGDDSQTTNADATFLAEGVALQKDASGNYTTTTAVAKIGGKNYATLADAIKVADGKTIVMLQDVTDCKQITINKGITITIDLNGKTISGVVTNSYGLFKNSGTLTIDDTATGGKLYNNANTPVIKNAETTSVVTINGGTIQSATTSTSDSSGSAISNNTGTVTINGGNISASKHAVYTGANSSSYLYINGGTFTSGTSQAVYVGNGKCDITGGTFTPAAGFDDVYLYNGALKAPETVSSNASATFTNAADGYVYSLAGAVYGATAGETVTMLKDVNLVAAVTFNKDLTLDLNGKNIQSPVSAFKVTAGTLTIDGEGLVKGANPNASATSTDPYAAVWANGGNVIINGGTFDEGGVDGSGNSTVFINKAGTITVNGGTFKNSATFDGKYWIFNIQDAVKETASIVVKGGKFYNFDPANNTNDGNSDGNGTNYVPEDYVTSFLMDGSDNVYEVKEGQWIAKVVGGVDSKFRFATLDDAITAANGAGKDVTIILLADATATVEPADNVTIDADGKALTLPTFTVADGAELSYAKVTNATDNTYKVTAATYNRTGATGTQWGTACLPFSFETAPAGYTLYTPSAVTTDKLTVTEVSYPVAIGTPVIFYKNNTAEAVITSTDASVKIDATPVAQSGTLALVGTFSQQKIESGLENIYYINGDKFHQAKASLTVPAYRAYINYYSAPVGQKPAVLSLFIGEDETTDIKTIATDVKTSTSIHDVNGRLLSAPQKGLNIVKLANGKTVKLIVK